MKLDGRKVLGMTLGLQMYKYGEQGKFGDNPDPSPSYVNVIDKIKWDAWTSVAGMDKYEARKKFLSLCLPVLKKYNVSDENPEKRGLEQAYEKCVKKKLASGMSQNEINSEVKTYKDQKLEKLREAPLILRGKSY